MALCLVQQRYNFTFAFTYYEMLKE